MAIGALVVGLTGGIASGKSAACARLASHGVTVIDADQAARDVVAPGEPAFEQVVSHFGPRVVAADGALNRARLRDLVYADPEQRQALEAIIHPRVAQRLRAGAQGADGPYCVLAIPLLAENVAEFAWLNVIVVVDVAESVQLQRLQDRDGIDAALAQQMVAAQATRSQRLAIADEVLPNHGTLADLQRATDELHRRLLQRARIHQQR